MLVVGDRVPEGLASVPGISAVPAQALRGQLQGATPDVVYVGAQADLGTATVKDVADMLDGRAATLVINSCGWSAPPDPALMAVRLDTVLATPDDPASCDAGGLVQGLAAALDATDRDSTLRNVGFRLTRADPVVPSQPGGLPGDTVVGAPVPAAAPSGGLIISALPPESLAAQSPTVVATTVSAPAPTPIPALPSGTEGPADPTLTAPAPQRANLPQPTAVVGDLAVLTVLGDPGPLGVAFPTREAIRQRDPAMFERLLGQGAFDPEPDLVANAIQTELARMKCYGGGIDGSWGSGSARALDRYRQTAGGDLPTDQPDATLFRAIARGDAVECAEVQPAAAAAPAATRQPQRGGGAAASNQRRNPAQGSAGRGPQRGGGGQQAQQPAAQPRLNPGMLSSGVFR